MKTPLKGLAAVAVLATLVVAAVAPRMSAKDAAHTFTNTQDPDVILHVKGLACDNCARTLKSALLDIDGIESVEVFLEDEQHVNLQLVEGATVDEETLRETVEGCGFVLEQVDFAPNDT